MEQLNAADMSINVSGIPENSSWWWSRDSQLLEDRVRHVGDPARAGTSRELLKWSSNVHSPVPQVGCQKS